MNKKLFSFKVAKFPTYKLEVASFQGYEAIGELYRYEIDLVSEEQNINFDEILQSEVHLEFHRDESDDIYIHGVLESFEAHQKIGKYIYYKAFLVPKLWWLSLAQHQQIFLDKKIPNIIEAVLEDAKFTSADYEFRLQSNYDKRDYVCQYKESRYDFIKRWMEREGIYFYFEHDKNGSKLIITDNKNTQKKLINDENIFYKPESGLKEFQHAISSIVYRSNNTVKSVRMKNYNYEKPSLDIHSVTDSSNDQYTQTYLFGNNLRSQEEAKRLSEINAQKYRCLDKEMNGKSNILSLRAGNIYTLKEYFRDDLNGDYLMLRVESKGSQSGFLNIDLPKDSKETNYYYNTFTMIPSQIQYRMQSAPPWPKISGMISATIDGQGSGETAELDKHGRYKVIMPFDISGRDNAKASAYLRMAQPSVGEKQGFHFPLHKGTEVLVAFKDGDPDQPVIVSAVPNINTPSPINENNVTKNIIQTHGGNVISMEDTPGKAHIKMGIHDDLCTMVMHNDDGDDNGGEYGIAWKTGGFWKVGSLDFANTIGGNKEEIVIGTTEDIKVGAALEVFAGAKAEYTGAELLKVFQGGEKRITPETKKLEIVSKTVGVMEKEVKETKQINITNIQQTVVEKVEITEDMIADYVKNIVTGMNLTEAVENKISTIKNEIKTMESSIEECEEYIVDIDDSIERMDSSFKKIEAVFGNIGSALQQIKISSLKTDIAKTTHVLHQYTSELTIFE